MNQKITKLNYELLLFTETEAEAKAKEESSSGESSSTETKTEETTTTKTVPEPTQTPPATSSIPETPSITPPEPKAPKAPDPKPEPTMFSLRLRLTEGYFNSTGHIKSTPDSLDQVWIKIKSQLLKDFGFSALNEKIYQIYYSRGDYSIKIQYPNDSKYNSKDEIKKYFSGFIKYIEKECGGDFTLKEFNTKDNSSMCYYVNKKKFLGLF